MMLARVFTSLKNRWNNLCQLPKYLRLERYLARGSGADTKRLKQARLGYESVYVNQVNPLISITIPTYNRGQMLVDRTLPSILNQTYQHFEVVIVGDCCQDNTKNLLRRMEDPRIHFTNLPDRGKYPIDPYLNHLVAGTIPINVAMGLAKGTWIKYMDDDDVLTPDHLEVMLTFALHSNSELVFAHHSSEEAPGVWKPGRGNARFPTGRLPLRGVIAHRTVMFRAYLRVFEYSLDAWKLNIGGDKLRFYRMGRVGVRAAHLDRIVAYKHMKIPYESNA